MQSNAPDVSTYLEQAPAERRAALAEIRRLCLERLHGFDECMEYGMPAYKRGGVVTVAFASQAQHISLYLLTKEVIDQYRDALPAGSTGKGCIRYRNVKKIDFSLVDKMLAAMAESHAKPC